MSRRSLRSLTVGDCDHYESPYMIGVAQACGLLGIEHRQVSIRRPAKYIERVVDEYKPDVIWTHMLLWPPAGSPPIGRLVAMMERAARRGARVVLHDGDYKEPTRHPEDISKWCSVALCNHEFDRSAWRTPRLRWPYFAMAQAEIKPPSQRWRCELWFAGKLDRGPVYAERTALVEKLMSAGMRVRVPTAAEGNTLRFTADIASSADAVLGFGRPGALGWVDTRVFQYPGAGGILVHDDVAGFLEPWVHYVPYKSGDASSVAEALAVLKSKPAAERRAMRERTFAHVQEKHSSVARVKQVLRLLGLAANRGSSQ